MYENYRQISEIKRGDVVRLADIMAASMMLYTDTMNFHEKYFRENQLKAQTYLKELLNGCIPYTLSQTDEKRVQCAHIAAVYMLIYDEPNRFEELLKSKIVAGFWKMSCSFFSACTENKHSNPGFVVMNFMRDNLPTLGLYSFFLPFVIGANRIDGWSEDIEAEYLFTADRVLNPGRLDGSALWENKFLENKRVAGKEKTLDGYCALWSDKAQLWRARSDVWDGDAIINPYYLSFMLNKKVWNGLPPDASLCQLVTKQDNTDIIHAVQRACKAQDKEKNPDETVQRFSPREFDTAFSFALLLWSSYKENERLKKQDLKRRLEEKQSVSRKYSDKLEKEHKKLSSLAEEQAKTIKRLQEQNNELYRKYAMLQNRINAIVRRNETGESEKSDDNAEVGREAFDAVNLDCTESAEIPQTKIEKEDNDKEYGEKLLLLSKNKKIVVVGGDPNLIKKIRVKQPNLYILDRNRLASCDSAVQAADIILFKTDSMSHALYKKCRNIAERYSIPFDYIRKTASVSKMEAAIYTIVEKHFNEKERAQT